MTIKDMHYDFKKKLNKVDSNQYRNLLIPEIDWVLNEAQSYFIDIIARSRHPQIHGFETNQKTIDDIRTIVVDEFSIPLNMITGDKTVVATLPEDYMYYIKSYVYMSKGSCKNQKSRRVSVEQHDDEFQTDFYKPSFTWRYVNALFIDEGMRLYSDGTFKIEELILSYIKKPKYIHNAEDFRGGEYKLPSGELLTGSESCELPWQTHKEIVDLAVLITTGELQIPDYQIKYGKAGFNFLKV